MTPLSGKCYGPHLLRFQPKTKLLKPLEERSTNSDSTKDSSKPAKANAYLNLDQQQTLPPLWVETTEELEDQFGQINEDLDVLQEKTISRFKQNFDKATDD